MRFRITAFAVLLAAAVAVPSSSLAAPKDGTSLEGRVTSVAVNADGVLTGIGLQPYGNEPLHAPRPCGATKMADHPELLAALDKGWRVKLKLVDGCFTTITIFP